MILYLLKFSACLAVFILFYKVFLENESFHKFKRFYLLGTLFLAVIIPLITFTTYVEVSPIEIPLDNSEMTIPSNATEHIFENPVNYWPTILWCMYIIGALVFSIRFSLNLHRIIKCIRQNTKLKNQSFIHVLLHDLVHPHTFLNYIFLNKTKYLAHEIPKEVLLHEETHAKEKHALDILLIEVFQIIFWFNPLLYFIKKDIKLNHEFLADQAVLNNGFELKNYQNTLLAFSSNATEPQLANAINYSSIKKRFKVMTTQTSKSIIWVRSLVILPVLAILTYSFSTNKIVEKPINHASETSHTARSIEIDVLSNGTYKIDGISATKESFPAVINKLHQDVSKDIRNQIINIHINGHRIVSNEEVWFIYNEAIKYGFHRIVTYNQEIIREKGNTPFAINNDEKRLNSTSTYIQTGEQSNPLPKIYGRVCDACEINLTKVDLEKLKIETNTNESIVSFKIKFVGKPTVSVKGNSLNSKAITNLKDSKHGDYLQIIDLKTESQSIKTFVLIQIVDKNELPPPPPPPVPENATPEQKERMKKAHEEYKHKKSTVESKEEMSVIPPPPPPIPADATPEQKEKYKKTSEEYYKKYKVENGKVSVKKPLAPKPPKSPLDHVVEMAKKNATFYYDGEKISSDKAINLLKQDTELSISTKNSDAKNPIVSITTNPVITDKNGKVITDIETLSEVEKNTRKDKVGYVRINEKVYYYSIKNKQISYFNRWGERVDKHGKPIKPN